MIERSNQLIYVKRDYFLPFKPLLDYEYGRFGYKKCDKNKGDKKFVNTAYYVRHSERPSGLYDFLYLINLPFSYFRTLVAPVFLVIFLASMLIEGTIGINLMLDKQILFLLLVAPAMLVSTFLSNMAYNIYNSNDTDGKIDRALNSRGWAAWTSYKDNDPRFTPPGSNASSAAAAPAKPKAPTSAPAPKPTAPKPTATANTPPAKTNQTNTVDLSKFNLGDEDGIITLLSANGEEIDFAAIAVIVYRGNYYAIMQPTELVQGMADDEALVFKIGVNASGENTFEIELDNNVVDAVFKEYDRLYDEANR